MSIALSEARGASLDDRCTELGEGGRADYEHQMVEWSASDQHTYADHIARMHPLARAAHVYGLISTHMLSKLQKCIYTCTCCTHR